MRVYRHQNGGGLKVFPAQASPDSLLDTDSSIEGETRLYSTSLRGSALKDTVAACSTITDSTVADCHISAGARISGSDIVGCDIVEAGVLWCRLSNCRIAGPLVCLESVKLVGVTVYGDAVLVGPWGLELEGAHIHAGEWREQPRHLLIEGDGIHVALVECTEGRAHMGCTCRPVEHWLERGPKLGRRLGWSEAQIEACRNFLNSL